MNPLRRRRAISWGFLCVSEPFAPTLGSRRMQHNMSVSMFHHRPWWGPFLTRSWDYCVHQAVIAVFIVLWIPRLSKCEFCAHRAVIAVFIMLRFLCLLYCDCRAHQAVTAVFIVKQKHGMQASEFPWLLQLLDELSANVSSRHSLLDLDQWTHEYFTVSWSMDSWISCMTLINGLMNILPYIDKWTHEYLACPWFWDS